MCAESNTSTIRAYYLVGLQGILYGYDQAALALMAGLPGLCPVEVQL